MPIGLFAGSRLHATKRLSTKRHVVFVASTYTSSMLHSSSEDLSARWGAMLPLQ